jgi:hypothetical protein
LDEINSILLLNQYLNQFYNGTEVENTLIGNSQVDYRKNLAKELKELHEYQMW